MAQLEIEISFSFSSSKLIIDQDFSLIEYNETKRWKYADTDRKLNTPKT